MMGADGGGFSVTILIIGLLAGGRRTLAGLTAASCGGRSPDSAADKGFFLYDLATSSALDESV